MKIKDKNYKGKNKNDQDCQSGAIPALRALDDGCSCAKPSPCKLFCVLIRVGGSGKATAGVTYYEKEFPYAGDISASAT